MTRASCGELDNTPLIARILRLRREEARLLGFASFAELSLASKMAPSVEAVDAMLEELRAASFAGRGSATSRSCARWRARAGAAGGRRPAPWDVAFWAERLREQRYAYTDEELRPYFPLPRVLDGLFALVRRLFGVTVRAADGEAAVWHPDVRFFRVFDEGGAEIAAFYLDPYCGPPRSAAARGWTSAWAARPAASPVAYLVCNQTPPVGGKPSLMTFDEVETLFHEFGHGLQHMLTDVDARSPPASATSSGTRSSCRASSWRTGATTARRCSGSPRHYETGAPLPEELFEKMRGGADLPRRLDMLRQLYFALTDLELHHDYDPDGTESPFDVQRRIARDHDRPAAGRGPLPVRLLAHLRRRLRGRLLQLQVGRGPVGRRVRGLRGGRARRPGRDRAHRTPLPRDRARPGRQPPPDGGLRGLPRPRSDHRGAAAPQRSAAGAGALYRYLTREPGAVAASGESTCTPLSSLAARIMPRLSTPRSLAGFRFATTTICLPTSDSGS